MWVLPPESCPGTIRAVKQAAYETMERSQIVRDYEAAFRKSNGAVAEVVAEHGARQTGCAGAGRESLLRAGQQKSGRVRAIDGKGGKSGKPMNGITEGKSDEFLKGSLLDPKKTIAPDTKMPAYKFTDEEVKAVIDYMRSLKKAEETQ